MIPFKKLVILVCLLGVVAVLAAPPTLRAQGAEETIRRPAAATPVRTIPPLLVGIDSPVEIAPGTVRLTVTTAAGRGEVSLLLVGANRYPISAPPGATTFSIDIPQPEPGFIKVRIRSGGMDSNALTVAILPESQSLTETLLGYASYQKVEVTDSGLELDRTRMVPIRNARVEVINRTTQSLVSVSETDERGQFQVAVPNRPDLTIRVASRLRSQDLKVLDNTNNSQPYWISRDVDMRDSQERVELIDTDRKSGAFNILEVLQRGNDLIMRADPRIVPPPVTVYWSEKNTNRLGNVRDGLVGTTYFDLASKTAFILGDRSTDSDEFDDSVILHEYAHMLAARFSRDDSPGGAHSLGDLLDPRVAWSEGFANFFSSAARGSSIYRDSKGPTGALGIRYDLEENVPVGDRPGYRSEASVQSLLWDLIDENSDTGDVAQFSFASVWAAFVELRNDRFVYLPYFFEHFLARNPAFSDALRAMVQLRSIDFQPDVRPSVTNPFPGLIPPGGTVYGEVDSLTTKRSNLAQSSHLFMFTISAARSAEIILQIDGLGPANNPSFNDLDLLLLDANGQRLQQSNGGRNGATETIVPPAPLLPGTYFVEIRSSYIRTDTNTPVYNSGHYRLSVVLR